MFKDSSKVQSVKNKIEGVVVGVVTDINQPDGRYEVKVKFPTLGNSDEESSHWVRIASLGGGASGGEVGTFWLPEVEDEVLVAFEHGDFNSPVIIAGMWNDVKKPSYANSKDSGKIKWASFQGKTEAKKNDLRA